MHYALFAAVVALDQASKALVSALLGPGAEGGQGGAVSVIPGFFDIAYVRNTGAAFSMLQGKTVFLALFAALLVVALQAFIFLGRKKEPPLLLHALSLISAGGLGNLIDRLRLGSVADFFAVLSFPVFNVADIAVCTGCGLALLHFALSEGAARKAAKGARSLEPAVAEKVGDAAEAREEGL